jgi:methanethiol S-methyltransferase
MFARVAILLYGLFSYAVFLGTFLYAIGFIGNFATPTSLDGERTVPLTQAFVIDVSLLALFALQHSGMARPAFKRWLTHWLPQAAERSTYVLLSSLALMAIFLFWQPIGGVIWNVQSDFIRAGLYVLFAAGWLTVLITTFLINHFDLFGLRQIWLYYHGIPYTYLSFRTPGPYRYVRHPLYVGWLMAFWFTPTMTSSHLVFALGTTAYILIAIIWEERDLLDAHPEYGAYREKVPMLIPKLRFSEPIRVSPPTTNQPV